MSFYYYSSVPFCKGSCGRANVDVQFCSPAVKHTWRTRNLCVLCSNSTGGARIQTNQRVIEYKVEDDMVDVCNAEEFAVDRSKRRTTQLQERMRATKRADPSLYAKILVCRRRNRTKYKPLFKVHKSMTQTRFVGLDHPSKQEKTEEVVVVDNEECSEGGEEEKEMDVEEAESEVEEEVVEQEEESESSESDDESERTKKSGIFDFLKDYKEPPPPRPCYFCETSERTNDICKKCKTTLIRLRT